MSYIGDWEYSSSTYSDIRQDSIFANTSQIGGDGLWYSGSKNVSVLRVIPTFTWSTDSVVARQVYNHDQVFHIESTLLINRLRLPVDVLQQERSQNCDQSIGISSSICHIA